MCVAACAGTLQLTGELNGRMGVIRIHGKPAAIWKLYEMSCEAVDFIVDASSKPRGFDLEDRTKVAKNIKKDFTKDFLKKNRSPAAAANHGGGGGGRPSNGSRMQAQAAAMREKQQLSTMRRSSDANHDRKSAADLERREPRQYDASRSRSAFRHGDEDENKQPNYSSGKARPNSGASGSTKPRGNPVNGQISLVSSFGRSERASAFTGGGGGGYRQDGMANLGNTCYMSAILQALLRLPSFVHDLRVCAGKLRERGSQLQQGTATSLFAELLAVVNALQAEGEQASVFNPKKLQDCIARRSPQFAGNAQQDAHEFLTDILDFMQAELRQHETGKAKAKADAAAAAAVESEEAEEDEEAGGAAPICPTALNFRCVIEHKLECCGCHVTSKRRELYHDLSLDLPRGGPEDLRKRSGTDPATTTGAIPIQQLFESYFDEEEVRFQPLLFHQSCIHLPSFVADFGSIIGADREEVREMLLRDRDRPQADGDATAGAHPAPQALRHKARPRGEGGGRDGEGATMDCDQAIGSREAGPCD